MRIIIASSNKNMTQLKSLCGQMPSLTSSRRYEKQATLTVKCSSNGLHSRRLASVSLLLLHCLYVPTDAVAATIFDKYMKRKKLDPLESYVPSVILAQMQIQELGELLEADKPVYAACRSLLRAGPASSLRVNIRASATPVYAACRSLLRAGPASSLRVNIRAVAQYASDGGDGKSAFTDVDQCLRALEDLDSQLLRASRNESDVSVESMKSKIGAAVNALNSLLNTVPADMLNKGKIIANAYQTQEEVAPDNQDPELKQLESLL